jgi:hypothetical protein
MFKIVHYYDVEKIKTSSKDIDIERHLSIPLNLGIN